MMDNQEDFYAIPPLSLFDGATVATDVPDESSDTPPEEESTTDASTDVEDSSSDAAADTTSSEEADTADPVSDESSDESPNTDEAELGSTAETTDSSNTTSEESTDDTDTTDTSFDESAEATDSSAGESDAADSTEEADTTEPVSNESSDETAENTESETTDVSSEESSDGADSSEDDPTDPAEETDATDPVSEESSDEADEDDVVNESEDDVDAETTDEDEATEESEDSAEEDVVEETADDGEETVSAAVPEELHASDPVSADETEADATEEAVDESAEEEAEVASDDEDENILVLIDEDADDDGALSSLPTNATVVIVSKDESIQDIADKINALSEESGETYDSLEIYSHTLELGSEDYEDDDDIESDSAAWASIGSTLTGDAPILWFGCDAAGDEDGQEALTQIAEMTGHEVLASTDSTGEGGDWVLEYSTETGVAMSGAAVTSKAYDSEDLEAADVSLAFTSGGIINDWTFQEPQPNGDIVLTFNELHSSQNDAAVDWQSAENFAHAYDNDYDGENLADWNLYEWGSQAEYDAFTDSMTDAQFDEFNGAVTAVYDANGDGVAFFNDDQGDRFGEQVGGSQNNANNSPGGDYAPWDPSDSFETFETLPVITGGMFDDGGNVDPDRTGLLHVVTDGEEYTAGGTQSGFEPDAVMIQTSVTLGTTDISNDSATVNIDCGDADPTQFLNDIDVSVGENTYVSEVTTTLNNDAGATVTFDSALVPDSVESQFDFTITQNEITITAAAGQEPTQTDINTMLDGFVIEESSNGSIAADKTSTGTITVITTDVFDEGIEFTDTGTYDVAFDVEVNNAPDAVDNNYEAGAGESVTGNVVSDNTGEGVDGDPDGEPVVVDSFTQPDSGTVTVDPDGTFEYTPDADTPPGDQTFTYTVVDKCGEEDTATVTITVQAAPEATDDSFDCLPAGEETFIPAADILGNDTDADSTDLLLVPGTGTTANGTDYVITEDGITITGGDDFFGQDDVPYTVTDDDGNTDEGNIALEFNGEPDAVDNNYDAGTGESVSGNLLTDDTGEGVDSDPDGEPLVIDSFTQPDSGTVTVAADGTFEYTPDADTPPGDQTFTYTVIDECGEEDTATVTITVQAPPDVCVDTDGDGECDEPQPPFDPDDPENSCIAEYNENDDSAEQSKDVAFADEDSTEASTVVLDFTENGRPLEASENFPIESTDAITVEIQTNGDGQVISVTMTAVDGAEPLGDYADIINAAIDGYSDSAQGDDFNTEPVMFEITITDDDGNVDETPSTFGICKTADPDVCVDTDGDGECDEPQPPFDPSDPENSCIADYDGNTGQTSVDNLVAFADQDSTEASRVFIDLLEFGRRLDSSEFLKLIGTDNISVTEVLNDRGAVIGFEMIALDGAEPLGDFAAIINDAISNFRDRETNWLEFDNSPIMMTITVTDDDGNVDETPSTFGICKVAIDEPIVEPPVVPPVTPPIEPPVIVPPVIEPERLANRHIHEELWIEPIKPEDLVPEVEQSNVHIHLLVNDMNTALLGQTDSNVLELHVSNQTDSIHDIAEKLLNGVPETLMEKIESVGQGEQLKYLLDDINQAELGTTLTKAKTTPETLDNAA